MRFLFVASLFFTIAVDDLGTCLADSLMSILGDQRMKNHDARFAFEALNACNEVGEEAAPPGMGSPRLADCADLICKTSSDKSTCHISQKVNETSNLLKAGDAFPGPGGKSFNSSSADVNNYAAEKEKYLGSLCQKNDTQNGDWYFWMIMVKNGNLDMKNTTVNCPRYGRKANETELTWDKPFPCYGSGCMNQPLVFRNQSRLNDSSSSLTGMFYGSYDHDAKLTSTNSAAEFNKSYFAVTWQKNITNTSTAANTSWILSFKLTTSPNYPWLSLFLRADAATGLNAGYHYNGRGIMNITSLKSPNFTVTMNLHIIKGGGEISQFYLTNIGGCWKNDGSDCDGDVTTDVTRYVQMIINPTTTSTCNKDNLKACPPYHTDITMGEIIYKNQTDKFPYDAYHLYCAPGNAKLNDTEIDKCDPFTNPMQQELLQILPHLQWDEFGYPATKEEVGWEGDSKFWNLDAGDLITGMYFYQDPGNTKAATQTWTSIMVGTEMYNLKSEDRQYTAEWTVSNFDVVVPNKTI